MTQGNGIRPGDKLPGGIISADILSPEWVSMDNLFLCDDSDLVTVHIHDCANGETLIEYPFENPEGYFEIRLYQRKDGWHGYKSPLTKITRFLPLDNKGDAHGRTRFAKHYSSFESEAGHVYCIQSKKERTLIMNPAGAVFELHKLKDSFGEVAGSWTAYSSIKAWAVAKKLKLVKVSPRD